MSLRGFVPAHSLFLARTVARWKASRRGNIAVLTALLMAPIVGMMGLALDYGHLILVKSRLDQAALSAAGAAANAARNVVQSATRDMNNYDQTDFNTKAIDDGQTIGANIFKAQFGSTTPTVNVTVKRLSNTFVAQVEYTASIETYFAKYFNVNVFNIRGQQSIITGMQDSRAKGATPASIIDERWDAPSASPGDSTKPVINDWYSGTPGTASPLSGPTGPWIDAKASNSIRVGNPDGSIAPIVSKKVYLEEGDYQLRYWYQSTVAYPDYEPVFICGTVEDEMHWVTSSVVRELGAATSASVTYGGVTGAQTSRAGVYLVPILGNPQLAATAPAASAFPKPPKLPWSGVSPSNLRPDNSRNRVDICAYSSRWIERNIPIKITNSGYFWLNFVAEPPESSTVTIGGVSKPFINGFYLGRVQLCPRACAANVTNNWPWSAYTTLYKDTFDENPIPTPGDNFQKKRNIYPLISSVAGRYQWTLNNDRWTPNYETKADWVVGRFGGNFTESGFKYESTPSGGVIVRSTALGMWMYRRLLLTPGVYKFQFKLSRNENQSAKEWCGPGTPPDPDSIVAANGWVLKNALLGIPTCTCPAGYVTTVFASDEAIGNPPANRDLKGTAPEIYQSFVKNSDGSIKVDRRGNRQNIDSSIILSDCHPGNSVSRTFGDVFCVLVPRTQFYGFRFAVSGPTLTQRDIDNDPALSAANPQVDVQLNTGGAYFDGVEVTLLSPGVQNRFTRTIDGPGDFDDYPSQCISSLAGSNNALMATTNNIMSGGIPMWPGYSTRTLDRVIVTAPSN